MASLEVGLIGHWPLIRDTQDDSPLGHRTRATDVALGCDGPGGLSAGAGGFNGVSSALEVADHPALRLGTGDLTLAAWVWTDERNADVVGDILSLFDPATRCGFNLSIITHSGVTSGAMPNRRHLQFGIDQGRSDAGWEDHGRPGNAALVAAMAVADEALYAGTLEIGAGEIGHLWRYRGERRWTDLGNPDGCNAIHSVVEFDGAVYCGTARYNTHGSWLGETLNRTPGGKVYRVSRDGDWMYCGYPGAEDATPESVPVEGYSTGKADDAMALTVFRGQLYCVSNHRKGAGDDPLAHQPLRG